VNVEREARYPAGAAKVIILKSNFRNARTLTTNSAPRQHRPDSGGRHHAKAAMTVLYGTAQTAAQPQTI